MLHPILKEFLRVVLRDFPGVSDSKEPDCNTRDLGSGRSPGREDPLEKGMNGYPLQYSCLENPMDRGAWRATVHGDMTEWLTLSPSRGVIVEANFISLVYSASKLLSVRQKLICLFIYLAALALSYSLWHLVP